MMRRVGLGHTQPLRISNRNSVGFDSISSAAPPCYTSQRGGTSIVERSPTPNDDDDDTSASMHSFPDDVPAQFLPSPYSTEDLRLAASSRDEEDAIPAGGPPSVAHTESFMHTSSQRTTSTPPPTSDTEHSATPTRSVTTSSVQSPAPYHNRHARHYSMPSSPYGSHQGLPRTSEASSSLHTLYHHPPSSQPTGIGHLTYRHNKDSYEVYHDANEELVGDDEDRPNREQPPMDSTITFLPEGMNSSAPHLTSKPQPNRRARLTKAGSASGAHKPHPDSAGRPLEPALDGRATNYVSLSRKSTFKKPRFFVPSAVTSSITGKFTIDPSLYIPSSLLKAVESPGKIALDIAAQRVQAIPSESKAPLVGDNSVTKPRQKNLVLEVENGGIDVDVHLVPFPQPSAYPNATPAMNPLGSEADGRRMRSNGYPSATRLSLDRHYQFEEVYNRPGIGQRQITRSSVDGHGYSAAPSIRKYSAPRSPLPTLIDLRLKEMKGIVRKSSSMKQKNEFSLIARLHAPNPRPPFHLVASTIDIPPAFRPIPPAEAIKSDNKPAANAPPPIVRRPVNRTRPIATLPRSSLTLHLPRTFQGPLMVHIAAGDIDAHMRLSKGLVDASVVLAETAYSRGYFVGKLSELDDKEDTNLGPEWVLMNDDDELMSGEATLRPSGKNGLYYEGMAGLDIQSHDRVESSNDQDEDAKPKGENDEEWGGDKADVHVGHGKVYLQFMGEEDPFGKKGRFWHKMGRRHR